MLGSCWLWVYFLQLGLKGWQAVFTLVWMWHRADLWKEAAVTEDPVITACAFPNHFSGSLHEPQTELVRAMQMIRPVS